MKTGPHAQRTTPEGLRWAAVAPCVKQVDGLDLLRAAPADAVRVFRHYFPSQPLDGDPAWVARTILAGLGDYRHPRLVVEVYNEEHEALGGPLERHCDLIAAVAPRLQQAGLKVAAFSFAPGNPTLEAWEYLCSRGFGGSDVVSLHEYWNAPTFDGVTALYYRKLHERNPNHPPLLITEIGRGGNGWKSQVNAEQYLAELAAYDAEINRDPYVLGAHVFTTGYYEPWGGFNVDELADRIANLTSHSGTGGEMPQVGQGFGKAEPLVGPWLEDEIYHAPGTDHEVSLAVGERGFAVWSRRTNETVAYVYAGQQIHADWGNLATTPGGPMRRAR